MSLRSAIRALMGSTYEEMPVVAPTEVASPLVPVPLDAPEPVMMTEETLIQDMRRAEFLADAPVLSANDATVRQASFRDRFVPPAKTAQTETRARLQLEADAPVSPCPSRLVTSPEIDRAERLAERRSYQGLVPVARRTAEA